MPSAPHPAFARVSWGVLAFVLAVVLWGAYVRATGSGAGCGSHWPDCNGEIVPRAASVETAIELTHRASSGLAMLLVLAQFVWALRIFERGHPVRRAAFASVVLMLGEAAIGAGLVLLELVGQNASAARAAWMALHLVNTFLLVGALALTALLSGRRLARPDFGGGLGWLLAIAALALLLTGMAGAVAALGDTLFPARTLAEGLAADASADAHLLVRLRIVHPILAALTFVYAMLAAGVSATLRPAPDVRRAARALAILLVAQMGAGLLDVALLAPVWLQLVHLAFADLVWIALVALATTAALAPRASAAARPIETGGSDAAPTS